MLTLSRIRRAKATHDDRIRLLRVIQQFGHALAIARCNGYHARTNARSRGVRSGGGRDDRGLRLSTTVSPPLWLSSAIRRYSALGGGRLPDRSRYERPCSLALTPRRFANHRLRPECRGDSSPLASIVSLGEQGLTPRRPLCARRVYIGWRADRAGAEESESATAWGRRCYSLLAGESVRARCGANSSKNLSHCATTTKRQCGPKMPLSRLSKLLKIGWRGGELRLTLPRSL